MVVMIVAQEHGIDAGKILPPYAWEPSAARTDPGERTCPLRPDRIRQNVGVGLLEQHGGMVDQRDAQLIAVHPRRGFRLLYIRYESRGRLRPAGELPSQGIEKAASLRRMRIEETLPVKVRHFKARHLKVRNLKVRNLKVRNLKVRN